MKKQPKPSRTGHKKKPSLRDKSKPIPPRRSAKTKAKQAPSAPRQSPKNKPAVPTPPSRVTETARPSAPADYERHKERSAQAQRTTALAGRDIGAIPPIADPARRERCRNSLIEFCLTYNPEPFYLPWCQDLRDAAARIEESAMLGALYAFALDRGKGKTTICRMATLWGISYRWRVYAFLIGANNDKAIENLKAIKTFIRFLPRYAADFPEIAFPAQRLAGIANRASGQLCLGQSTLLEWANDRVILPTVPPPANWPKHWPLRADGMVPTSGSAIGVSGLTGDGIRGSLLTLSTGEMIRPDWVLLDDPQSRESAFSPTQNQDRAQLVAADVLGMAGPGKTLSAVMPCTAIAPDDMVCRILDRTKNPLWRGTRSGMLTAMPANMAAWERYFEIYRECAQREPPNYDDANAAYLAERETLDAGTAATWPENKLAWEVSGIQHAMHLYCRDSRAFMAEYMNQPDDPSKADTDFLVLSVDDIISRVNQHERRLVPRWSNVLTAAIDVHKGLLYYNTVGFGSSFNGAVLDYGTWPRQLRTHFRLRDAQPNILDETKLGTIEAALWQALTALCEQLFVEWKQDGGGVMRIERCLIDAGWQSELIYKFCRESPHGAVLTPSRGRGVTAKDTPITEWKRQPGDKRGLHWTLPRATDGRTRLLTYDANFWKSFTRERLEVPVGDLSALTMFGAKPAEHRLFAEHQLAEFRVKTEGRGRRVDQWAVKPEQFDNHWADTLTMAHVAASMAGVQPPGLKNRLQSKKRPTLAELRANATGRGQ